MRALRDFQPGKLYGVTQRGNGGQWVHRDRQDFLEARKLMISCAQKYGVRIHFYIQLHNHSHWVFEASTKESISNLMRDMQGRYSRYLNRKYRKEPWLLLAPLSGEKVRRHFSRYLRAGPTNWTARFDAEELDEEGAKSFGRYIENNAVKAKLVKRARNWEWSSAAAHCAGHDDGGVLCLERWRLMFGNAATIVASWRVYLNGAEEERERNLAVILPYNRPLGWWPPMKAMTTAGAAGGVPD